MRWIVAFAAMLGLLLPAGYVGAVERPLYVEISPAPPTDLTPVRIKAWTWFGDTGQRCMSAGYVREENQIDVDVFMQDLHGNPNLVFLQVVTPAGGSVNCGVLPAGLYHVTADMWMTDWGSNVPEHYGSGSASFTVTPEPSTLGMLGIGGVALLACTRRRDACDEA